ncbi:hypothetical protein PSN45_000118 [Yamadazyma tenuis]|uniref:Ubiquitin 3 binding protein But2 C-terminal domain-containing protein n=1 Tax=Candida tenuis (strain ATCC 10573 / BCRC 21748 / CBS 615 / JCM 9827 / NBRC 10315 / NRRL Y-1498 / VKM Y-70) TaxID=590646 RepID=G3BAN2_CANTC|nr:uncharacterized protein CANTEDRAFT_135403 [Yamadazyma tenuis ATCC 10573]EGV61450.1 hypothetical protein CANTEDRAFT_135403 [Yamadazyma tenuis ATCC 10573]WEJ92663.1 hypothetical protein PSN45_000118 [Yamadazyma tenuis]
MNSKFLQLSVLLFSLFGTSVSFQWYLQEHPILVVNALRYDKSIIFQRLQNSFEKMYHLPDYAHAKLYIGDKDTEKKCITGTEITFFVKGFEIVQKEYEASECRINLNPEYQVILSPTAGFSSFIHQYNDPLTKSVEMNLMKKFSGSKIPKIGEIKFYNFHALNSELECLVEYQEISQVKMKEWNLQVHVQEVIEVPESCGFQRFDKSFDGTFVEALEVNIPINGTFYCRNGRSSTCKKSTAEFSTPRYKLFRDQ